MQLQNDTPSSSHQISAFVKKSLIVKRRRWVLLSCEATSPTPTLLLQIVDMSLQLTAIFF
jgi:hypothetical protein